MATSGRSFVVPLAGTDSVVISEEFLEELVKVFNRICRIVSAPTNPHPREEIENAIVHQNGQEPIVVAVKKPSHYLKPRDYYNVPTNGNNYALVVNITKFQDPRYNCADIKKDTMYMRDLWWQLGFNVIAGSGVITKSELIRIIKTFKTMFTNENKGSCVVYIGSHGHIASESHQILTSDIKNVDFYRDVMHQFNSANCPSLKGMPKMFLINTCQNFSDLHCRGNTKRNDTAPEVIKNSMDDTVVCFSSIPGNPSYYARESYLGSRFTYCLRKVFMNHAYHLDVHGLLKKTQDTMRKVKSDVHGGQMCAIVDHGIRQLYFEVFGSDSASVGKHACDGWRITPEDPFKVYFQKKRTQN